MIAKVVDLWSRGGATSDSESAIPSIARVVDLWSKGGATSDAKVGRPCNARVVYISMKDDKDAKGNTD